MTDAVAAAIVEEMRLLDPVVRADAGELERLLAPDFTEIGKGGRVWSRDEVLDALAAEPAMTSTASAFSGLVVAAGVVLVSYETLGSSGPVRRSTLWRETSSGWQAVFHQATPVGE